MKYIDNEDLKYVLNLVTKETNEYCGYLKPLLNEQVKLYVDGRSGYNGRKLCVTNPPYKEYLWHTHPINSKSYPSTEDILKVLKPRSKPNQILDSILFSAWGIWEFHCSNKQDTSGINTDILNGLFNNLYHSTYTGRGKQNDTVIILTIQNVMDYLIMWNFEMSFTPWDKVTTPHYLVYT